MDREQAAGQRQIVRRLHRTAAKEDGPVALGLDHAPAGAAQAGVDADDPDGLANRWGCHGVVITPEPGERNIKRTEIPAKGGRARPERWCALPTIPSSSLRKAGTHTPRPNCFGRRQSSRFYRKGNAVWVPAFAGTTSQLPPITRPS